MSCLHFAAAADRLTDACCGASHNACKHDAFCSLLLQYYYSNIWHYCFIGVYIHYAYWLAEVVFALCLSTVQIIL